MARMVVPIRLDEVAVRQADDIASRITERPGHHPRLREYTTRSAVLRFAVALGLERIEEELRQPSLPLEPRPK